MIMYSTQAAAKRVKQIIRASLLICAIATIVSSYEMSAKPLQGNIKILANDPRITTQVLKGRNLASLSDGSSISSVNGRQNNIVIKPGDNVRIIGKGFDQRRQMSVVGLFLPGTTTGALLDIVSWSDTEIIAQVPINNANLTTASDKARLKVVPIRASGLMLDLTVENIRFQLASVAIREVNLIALPDRMIRLAQQPGWTTERQPKAPRGAIGPGPGAALYVKRTKGATQPGDCTSFNDAVDLTDIFRNNYRVKSYRKELFPERPGFVKYTGIGPRRSGTYGEDINGNKLKYGSPPAQFAKIFTTDQPLIYKVGNLYVCDAGYRLHLTVEGPADIDPITGNRIRPIIVN